MSSRRAAARVPFAHAPWTENDPSPWQNQAAILAQPLDAATPFGAETPLDNATRVNTTTAGQQFDAAVAALTSGGYVVIWDDNQRQDVFGQRYDSAGNTLGSEFQVNTTTAGTQFFPTVGALTDGGFIVAWQSGTLDNADIKAQRFDAGGNPAGAEIAVNASTADEQLNARAIGLDGGGFLISWDTITSGKFQEVSAQLYDAAGTAVGGQFVINTTTADQQGVSTLASLPGGGFVAIWQSITPSGSNNSEIMGQRFNGNGQKIGPEFQVNTTTPLSQYGNDVARLANGGFVVTWSDPGTHHVVGRIYDSGGNATTGELLVYASAKPSLSGTTVAALSNGGFVVSWAEGDGAGNNVEGRAFDATGVAITDVFAVSQNAADFPVQTVDGIATLVNGTTVMAWDGPTTSTDQDIYERRFLISGGDAQTGTSGDDNKSGTTGDDRFDMSQGGNDIVSGGDGNDGFFFGAALTAADQIDGGPGTNDQIGLQGDYSGANALTLGPATITGIEAIVVLPGYSYQITTVDANVVAGGVLTIQATRLTAGESLIFNGAAEHDGRFMIFGGQGADNLTGGSGDDGFYFGPGGFNGSDTINGGPGSNDQLGLDGDYTITLGGNLSGIEVVVLLHGPAATPNHFVVTAADSLVGAGQTMTIFGLQVETAITINGAAELDGAFKIYGGLTGDTLTGGHGNDWIFGGGGADTLAGGAGNDIFYYDDVTQSTAAATDTILDFTSGDKVDVSGIDAIAGGANDAFTFLGSGAFTSHAGELRAVNTSGNNWVISGDTNGDGVADFQLNLVASDAHPLTSADFTL